MGQENGESQSSDGMRSPGWGMRPTVYFASQMVFYIEACESGSMMSNLPSDINGRWWEPWPLSQAGRAHCSVCSWSFSGSANVRNQMSYVSRRPGQPVCKGGDRCGQLWTLCSSRISGQRTGNLHVSFVLLCQFPKAP